MNKLIQWLNGPSRREGKTNLMYLAELVAVNGGSIDIHKLGAVKNDSPWGRSGLTPNEALDLTGMIQFACGLMYGIEQDLFARLHEFVQNEITKQLNKSRLTIPSLEEIETFSKGRK